LALIAQSAQAGTATYDFTTDPTTGANPLTINQTGFTDINGTSVYWKDAGGNPGGFLGVCWPLGSSTTIARFPDIDNGQLVSSFTLETDLRIGNPQQNERPADGFSINFARDTDPVLTTDPPTAAQFATSGAVETGTSTGLAILFDTWAGNALPDGADIEGIIVRVDNRTVLRQAMPVRNGVCDDATSLQTGPRDLPYWENARNNLGFPGDPTAAFEPASWAGLCWQRLRVELDDTSKLTVTWKGQVILDHYQTTFFPSPGAIVLAGRTGGADEHTHFDNLTLTTVAAPADIEPPTMPGNLRANVIGAYRVVLEWDASTDNNFRVAYDLEINGTVNPSSYVLTVNDIRGLTASTPYSFRVRARDLAGNVSAWTAPLAVTTVASVPDPAFAGAKVYSDGETGLGTAVSALLGNPIYPDSPTSIRALNGMVMSYGEPAFGDTYGDNLGVRIAGTVTPAVTGEYNFFVRSDDASELYLNAFGAAIPVADGVSYIATETGCCEAFKEQTDPVTDQPYETTTTPIQLTAGQSYGILFLVKEGGGGDWGQVAWRRVGDTTAASALPPIGAPYFASDTVPQSDPVGAVVNITQQPQSAVRGANESVTFTVAAQTSSPYTTTTSYQWYKNGVAVPATGTTYTIPVVPLSDNGAVITVRVAVPGLSVTSDPATLTVNPDVTRPTVDISGIHGTADLTHVNVRFTEPVTDPTALSPANYAMQPTLAVTGVTRVDQFTVQLTTAAQTPATKYTLTVNNVADNAGNTAANAMADWYSWVVVGTVGPVTVEIYDGAGGATAGAITGTAVAALTSYAGYPASPDVTATINAFNTRLVYADDTHENYGGRMTGVITPTETGSYRFFTYSDDASEVWLNKTGTSEAGLEKIAEETGCCNPFTEPGTARTSAAIPLTGGQSYLLRGLWKEGGGGDYMYIAWRKEGTPVPAAALLPIPGPFDPWAGAPSVTTQPMGAAVAAGASATFTADANIGLRPVSYQWQRLGPATSWTDIAGATGPSCTIADVDLSKVGGYRCLVSNSVNPAGVGSRVVLLTLANSFVIEAEDFDYNGGQHQAAADVMPYTGFAYDGLSATYDVDYHNDNNDSITYRRGGDIAVAGHGVSMDNVTGNVLSVQRGAWDMVNNYKIGWIGTGDWHNFTRPVPAGTYTAFAALSYDGNGAGQLKAKLSKVTAGVGTPTQTLVDVGLFDQVGSRGWGQNNLVPMKDAGGATAVFDVTDPVTTLRMSHDSGDFDWFMLVPAASQAQPVITGITVGAGGAITVTWTGGGVLEATDSLTTPNWQTVATSSPATLTPPAGSTELYGRIKVGK
jgi:hypothetical protein